MAPSRGRARSTAAAAPPIMKLKLPAAAPSLPPETGASTNSCPAEVTRSASCRAVSTSIVEQSMNRHPAFTPTPRAASYTERTCSPSGSMVTMQSLSLQRRSTDSTLLPNSRIAFASRSHPCRSKPCERSRFAIGIPIVPSPINPVFMIRLHLRPPLLPAPVCQPVRDTRGNSCTVFIAVARARRRIPRNDNARLGQLEPRRYDHRRTAFCTAQPASTEVPRPAATISTMASGTSTISVQFG